MNKSLGHSNKKFQFDFFDKFKNRYDFFSRFLQNYFEWPIWNSNFELTQLYMPKQNQIWLLSSHLKTCYLIRPWLLNCWVAAVFSNRTEHSQFKIRTVRRSENQGGASIIWPPGLNRVNRFTKIQGAADPQTPPVPTALFFCRPNFLPSCLSI